MEFSSTTTEEFANVNVTPIPDHLLKPVNDELYRPTKEEISAIPKAVGLLDQSNYLRPLKRQIPDDFYVSRREDVEFLITKSLEKEIRMLQSLMNDIENEDEHEYTTMERFGEVVKSRDRNRNANGMLLNSQLIDELYGTARPIGSGNDSKSKCIGLISLETIPHELDEVFDEFIMKREEKENIIESFDKMLEKLIIEVHKNGSDRPINLSKLKTIARKMGMREESIESAYTISTWLRTRFERKRKTVDSFSSDASSVCTDGNTSQEHYDHSGKDTIIRPLPKQWSPSTTITLN